MKKVAAKAPWSLLLLALLLPGIGCHKEQVQVYQVSQGQDQPQQVAAPATNAPASGLLPGHPDVSSMQSMPAGMVAPDTSAAQVTWTTPAGWTQVPPSEMRVGSFKITGADGKQADVSIVPLPGMAGGDFANVNRWRGQVGLPAAADGSEGWVVLAVCCAACSLPARQSAICFCTWASWTVLSRAAANSRAFSELLRSAPSG